MTWFAHFILSLSDVVFFQGQKSYKILRSPRVPGIERRQNKPVAAFAHGEMGSLPALATVGGGALSRPSSRAHRAVRDEEKTRDSSDGSRSDLSPLVWMYALFSAFAEIGVTLCKSGQDLQFFDIRLHQKQNGATWPNYHVQLQYPIVVSRGYDPHSSYPFPRLRRCLYRLISYGQVFRGEAKT